MHNASESVPNIIIFGETGAGKSSVINMLDGPDHAEVSSSPMGVSTKDICYRRVINGTSFNVFDTAGFNQPEGGTVSARKAIEMLHNLICRLDDGLSLLVFVMRAPSITPTALQLYKIFYQLVCNAHVPIVIVVTGLEFEGDMDGWYNRNKEVFGREKMQFAGFACITTISSVEIRYQESKSKVEQVIYRNYTRGPPTRTPVQPRKSRFTEAVLKLIDIFGFKCSDANLLDLVKSCGRLNDQEAKDLITKLKAKRDLNGSER